MTKENTPQEGKEMAEKIWDKMYDAVSTTRNGHGKQIEIQIITQALSNIANQKLKEGLERALEAVEKRSKEPFTQYGQCSDFHFGDALDAIREEIEKLTPKE